MVHLQHDRKCNMSIGNAAILIKTRKGRKEIAKITVINSCLVLMMRYQ